MDAYAGAGRCGNAGTAWSDDCEVVSLECAPRDAEAVSWIGPKERATTCDA